MLAERRCIEINGFKQAKKGNIMTLEGFAKKRTVIPYKNKVHPTGVWLSFKLMLLIHANIQVCL
ncbi:hypothetical protein AE956_08780 [Bacteroides fragilis]|nr:hypothetical protein [Bacteroides fragilis]